MGPQDFRRIVLAHELICRKEEEQGEEAWEVLSPQQKSGETRQMPGRSRTAALDVGLPAGHVGARPSCGLDVPGDDPTPIWMPSHRPRCQVSALDFSLPNCNAGKG